MHFEIFIINCYLLNTVSFLGFFFLQNLKRNPCKSIPFSVFSGR